MKSYKKNRKRVENQVPTYGKTNVGTPFDRVKQISLQEMIEKVELKLEKLSGLSQNESFEEIPGKKPEKIVKSSVNQGKNRRF